MLVSPQQNQLNPWTYRNLFRKKQVAGSSDGQNQSWSRTKWNHKQHLQMLCTSEAFVENPQNHLKEVTVLKKWRYGFQKNRTEKVCTVQDDLLAECWRKSLEHVGSTFNSLLTILPTKTASQVSQVSCNIHGSYHSFWGRPGRTEGTSALWFDLAVRLGDWLRPNPPQASTGYWHCSVEGPRFREHQTHLQRNVATTFIWEFPQD